MFFPCGVVYKRLLPNHFANSRNTQSNIAQSFNGLVVTMTPIIGAELILVQVVTYATDGQLSKMADTVSLL